MKRVWTGRILSGLVVAFLLVELSMKLWQVGPAAVLPIRILHLGLLALFLVSRVAPARAMATHVQVQNPLFSQILLVEFDCGE